MKYLINTNILQTLPWANRGPSGRGFGHDDPVERDDLARRLQEICRLSGRFVLRSGQVSEFYFDKYQFEADPELLSAVADLAVGLIPAGTQVLAGLELGGVPVATAMSLATGLPQVLVRKEAKSYGTAKLAEGPDISRRQILVVEDVITTGGQVVASTEELRSLGAVVESVLCVIDRRPDPAAPDKLSDTGLSVVSLFTTNDLGGS
jgi:orotate phosphoribosyltransferase